MSDLLLWMPIGESREAIEHLRSLGWHLVAVYVQPSGCVNELVRMQRPESGLRREHEVVGQMVKEWGFLAAPPED